MRRKPRYDARGFPALAFGIKPRGWGLGVGLSVIPNRRCSEMFQRMEIPDSSSHIEPMPKLGPFAYFRGLLTGGGRVLA